MRFRCKLYQVRNTKLWEFWWLVLPFKIDYIMWSFSPDVPKQPHTNVPECINRIPVQLILFYIRKWHKNLDGHIRQFSNAFCKEICMTVSTKRQPVVSLKNIYYILLEYVFFRREVIRHNQDQYAASITRGARPL